MKKRYPISAFRYRWNQKTNENYKIKNKTYFSKIICDTGKCIADHTSQPFFLS